MARTKEAMARDIQVSLQNLRTEYIDLYQIHNPTAADLEQVQAPGGALEALVEAKSHGLIGHIGITLHSVELFEKAVQYDWVETIMFPYNIVETQGKQLMEECSRRNIGFICMKPLAGGAIENASLALRFVLSDPAVSVVIPGMATIEEAQQNLSAASNSDALSPAEQQEMDRIRNALGSQFCRRCNYCAPCAAGISIPAVFMMEGYYSRYDLQDWAKARYAAFEKKASACIGCGVCETRCPYHLPIRDMMQKAAKVFGE
jgi:predicted aldo/keto reductase-like oxidoreductase